MKTFKIYKHPSKGYEAVKVGVSWPGLFLGGLWLLYRDVAAKGFLFTIFWIWYMFKSVSGEVALDAYTDRDIFIEVIGLIIFLIVFVKGNDWVAESCEEEGYVFKKVIQTNSRKVAIALAESDDKEKTN
jgi:hypothetical protein